VKSTGNDIVALEAIDIQRTTSPAFYSKFITDEEQGLYQQSQLTNVPFEIFTWLLWSVKESVYKYLKRLQPDLIFSPAKIIIQNITTPTVKSPTDISTEIWENCGSAEEFYTGGVTFGPNHLYFQSKITEKFIASVVSDTNDFNGVSWGVKSIEQLGQENQSRQVRDFILAKLRSVLKIDSLRIEKAPAGYPVLFDKENLVDIPVSLAHHHNVVAYSFCIRPLELVRHALELAIS
jgi:phosphopantetheinyl transferase (holo-ACP synthase)